jgi:hypothetical protein
LEAKAQGTGAGHLHYGFVIWVGRLAAKFLDGVTGIATIPYDIIGCYTSSVGRGIGGNCLSTEVYLKVVKIIADEV